MRPAALGPSPASASDVPTALSPTPLTSQVPVWAVLDYTNTSCIERELLLAKISILGPEYAQEMLSGPTHAPSFDHAIEEAAVSPPPFVSTEGEQTGAQSTDKAKREEALARSFEHSGEVETPPSHSHSQAQGGPGSSYLHGYQSELYPSRRGGLSASEALIAKNLHLAGVREIASQFGGKIVDIAENSAIVELTAKSSRLDAFLSLMRPFGVLEAARSGECTVSTPRFRAGLRARTSSRVV